MFVWSTIMSLELHVRSSPKFLCMLPVAVALSSCGGVVIRYVLPVLWMTPYLLTSQGCSTSPPISWTTVHTQPWAWLWNVRSNTSCRPTGVWTWVLEVTSQVASSGAESAVYDCLVCVLLTVWTKRVARSQRTGACRRANTTSESTSTTPCGIWASSPLSTLSSSTSARKPRSAPAPCDSTVIIYP